MNRKKKACNTKDEIVLESLKLFSLKGFSNTSLRDILTATRISKGGFYNHFKSKEDLFLAVLAEAKKMWRQRNLANLDTVEGNINKLVRILKNFRDYYLKDFVNFPGGCIFITLSVELDDQNTHLSKKISDGFNRLMAMIKRYLDQAKDDGEINKNVSTTMVSEIIFNGILGASITFGMHKSEKQLNKTIKLLIDYLEMLKK
jgi:AcrR family transcriptional regulator